MRMNPLVVAVALTLWFSFGASSAEFVCRTESGYEIRRWELPLGEHEFWYGGWREDELRGIFAPFATAPLEGEWYVVASSDPGFFRSRHHLAADTAVSTTRAPVAYFFRVGDNAILEFGLPGREVRRVVLRGEDVFNRRIGRTELRFVGQNFSRQAGEEDCGRVRRTMLFVSESVDEDDLPEIARYYADLARVNVKFDFNIWASFEDGVSRDGVRFPSLESMPWFERVLAADFPEDPGPLSEAYFFFRRSEVEGEYLIEDGTLLGRKKRIDLTGPSPP
jgi:hypothetical protein